MSLRPATARWFELLSARNGLGAALECLAGTGAVELQAHSDASAAALLPVLRAALDEYKRLRRHYGPYWPEGRREPSQAGREPEFMASASLQRLRSWAIEADPLIDRLQKLARERSDLELLEGLLAQPQGELPDLRLFAQAGPVLASRACLFPSAPRALGIPPAVLALTITRGEESYLLAVGPAEQIAAFDDTLGVHNARRFALPAALPASRDGAQREVAARLAAVATDTAILETKMADSVGLMGRARRLQTSTSSTGSCRTFRRWRSLNTLPGLRAGPAICRAGGCRRRSIGGTFTICCASRRRLRGWYNRWCCAIRAGSSHSSCSPGCSACRARARRTRAVC